MKILTLVLITALLAIAATVLWLKPQPVASTPETTEPTPLYWVAPMDPNFRSDKPGKSPMGMDLIPVYEEKSNAEPGTVFLSGRVRNQLSIQTEPAKHGVLPVTVAVAGYVSFNEQSVSHVHPRVEGWLEKLFVKSDGEPVQAGAPLYAIYSPELVNVQEEYVIVLKSGDTRLIQLAEERLKALQIGAEQIQQLRKSRHVQQTVVMHARQGGFVQELAVREGMYVKPEMELMRIAKLNDIWVQAEIPEKLAAQIATGSPVTMSLPAFAGQQWHGLVDYVYPTLNAKNRTLKIRAQFSNSTHQLKPNMLARLIITARPRAPQVLIPQQALIRDGMHDRVVLSLGDGQFRSVAVTPGLGNGDQIEILSGLKAGQAVVSSGQFLIDSESNLSAAEQRLAEPENVDRVWVTVAVRAVSDTQVKLAHPPIESWDWPAMVMDFDIKAPETSFGILPVHYIRAQLSKNEAGEFWVETFDRDSMEAVFPEESSPQAPPQMDHSKHQMESPSGTNTMPLSQHH